MREEYPVSSIQCPGHRDQGSGVRGQRSIVGATCGRPRAVTDRPYIPHVIAGLTRNLMGSRVKPGMTVRQVLDETEEGLA